MRHVARVTWLLFHFLRAAREQLFARGTTDTFPNILEHTTRVIPWYTCNIRDTRDISVIHV